MPLDDSEYSINTIHWYRIIATGTHCVPYHTVPLCDAGEILQCV